MNQQVVAGLLEHLGHRVDVVGNGTEAVEMLQRLPYDLVLMDVQMPEMDGLEATARIRAAGHGNAAIPILALTANATNDERDRCFEAGMSDFLTKPIRKEALVGALARWQGERDAQVTVPDRAGA